MIQDVGLTQEKRELLNKGFTLYKVKLGDALYELVQDAVKSAQEFEEDTAEDTEWGQDLSNKLDEKVSREELVQTIDAALQARQMELIETIECVTAKLETLTALVLSDKVDSIKDAILAGFAKADDDAGITDTNYEATVAAILT